MHERFPKMIEEARLLGLNRIVHAASDKQPLGFVTSGLAYCYLEHALDLLGLTGRFPILKMGLTYPLDVEAVADFSEQVDQMVVVEEKRPFLEEQVKAAVLELSQAGRQTVAVWGKSFPGGVTGFPDTRGMNPSIVVECLSRLLSVTKAPGLDQDRIDREVRLIEETAGYELHATARTPSFCPGCPHRDSASVLNRVVDDFQDAEYMRSKHGRDEVDLVFHGDIGCYSLLKYKPFDRLMHNLSGMGLGGGTGAGIDPFIRNKQLVFMGDSTFFHSGMAAISDSIKNGQDITYIILDNKTTAMTGHQPTPGVDVDIMGRPTFAQDIESIVRGMAGDHRGPVSVVRMNPAEREAYREVVEETLLKDGVKVLIADKECGITFHRRQRNDERDVIKDLGFLPEERHINITPEVCEYCLECTRATGCSGLTVEETLHGPKVVTDLSLCVADGACTKVTVANGDKTCPSFEEVVIHRARAPEVRTESIELTDLPEPEADDFDEAWYAYVGGVGGMGVNTISAVIGTAGAREGYTVRFTNKKGLAIRNGGVYSHLSFTKDDRVMSQITPYGHADLLLGLDILEAVRGVDPNGPGRVASPENTTVVVETGKRETIMTMTGIDDFDTADLEAWIKRYSKADRYFGMDLSEISERFLGNKIYANSILLGAAFQRGALPVSLENLRWAMKVNIRSGELDQNLRAFEMGRLAAIKPEAFDKPAEVVTYRDLLEDKADILARTRGEAVARRYRETAEIAQSWPLGEDAKLQFALGVYDLTQWGGHEYVRSYVDLVTHVYDRDTAERGYEATETLIPNLARSMAYKDEIYVAHLATSEEKRRRDHARYNIDPGRGDRIGYKHIMRPHFQVFGLDLRFDLSPPVWILKLMRRMTFLRKLLPAWHSEEKAYRDWFADLVRKFEVTDTGRYAAYVRVFKLPDQVRGYREVIWPKMQAAMLTAEYLLEGKGQLVAIDTYADPEPVLEPA